jgi:hypothetical protein
MTRRTDWRVFQEDRVRCDIDTDVAASGQLEGKPIEICGIFGDARCLAIVDIDHERRRPRPLRKSTPSANHAGLENRNLRPPADSFVIRTLAPAEKPAEVRHNARL